MWRSLELQNILYCKAFALLNLLYLSWGLVSQNIFDTERLTPNHIFTHMELLIMTISVCFGESETEETKQMIFTIVNSTHKSFSNVTICTCSFQLQIRKFRMQSTLRLIQTSCVWAEDCWVAKNRTFSIFVVMQPSVAPARIKRTLCEWAFNFQSCSALKWQTERLAGPFKLCSLGTYHLLSTENSLK